MLFQNGKQGPLQSFEMNDADRYELNIAALLA